MAIGLQKQVDAGQLTKEAALAEFSRRIETMTYDNGAGYFFVYTMEGNVVYLPGVKVGTPRLDVQINGRAVARELRDGVVAKGEHLMFYEFKKPDREEPLRKVGYAVGIPSWNMFVGTGAYLEDLDAKLKPIMWSLGLSILGIGAVGGFVAWLIGRSITHPLARLGARMRSLADGKLDETIPGIYCGDEVGEMATTVQVFKDNAIWIRDLEKVEAETRQRLASERSEAMHDIANDFERSVSGIVRSVATAAHGMQTTAQSMTATASDASSRRQCRRRV
jgi:methyl-accepting chemotaxis protein